MSAPTLHLVINSHPLPARERGPLSRLVTQIECWFRRAEQRRALACLSQRELRDIGVTLASALDEIEKPFWRA